MRLFSNEVSTLMELERELAKRTDVPTPYSIAVGGLLFDCSCNFILLKRGPACRDEIGKLEGIGGRFEGESDFKTALRREIVEEAGEKAEIEILKFFEVSKDTVTLPNSPSEKRHWIIVSYICLLKSGELVVCEPTKNSGFVRMPLEQVNPSELSSSAASSLNSLLVHRAEIKKLIEKHCESP